MGKNQRRKNHLLKEVKSLPQEETILPGEVFPNLRGLLENPPAPKTADLRDLAESLKVMTVAAGATPNPHVLSENRRDPKTALLIDPAGDQKEMIEKLATPNLHVLSEDPGEQMIVNSKDRAERAKVMINPILENPARTVLRRSPSANFPTNHFPSQDSLEKERVTDLKARISLLIKVLRKGHTENRMKKDHLFQKGEPIQEKEGHTNRLNR